MINLNNIKRNFSVEGLRRRITKTIRRFPIPLIMLAALSLWFIRIICFEPNISEYTSSAVAWGLSLAFLLSLAVNIWLEAFKRTELAKPLLLIVVALAAVDTVAIITTQNVNLVGVIGRAAIVTALVVAIVFLPARRKDPNLRLYTYTATVVVGYLLAQLLELILLAGVASTLATVEILFGEFSLKITWSIIVLSGFTIPIIFFLSTIPRPHRLGSLKAELSFRFIKYAVLILAVVYMCILYAYGLKILFTWSLPNGIIVWSVTVLSVVVLLVLYALQPFYAAGIKIALLARRCLPALMLPLFVLMAVGLIYRFNQYGVTSARVYVAIFAVWGFAVFAYLTFKRSVNFNMIPATFAVVFVAISVLPWLNVTSAVNRYMYYKLDPYFEGKVLPMSNEEYMACLESLPQEEREMVESRIAYLQTHDDGNFINEHFAQNGEGISSIVVDNGSYLPYKRLSSKTIPVPEGSRTLMTVHKEVYENESGPIDIEGNEITIPTDSLAALESLDSALVFVPNDSVVIVINTLGLTSKDNHYILDNVSGYLFEK